MEIPEWIHGDPVEFQFLDGDIRRLATCGTDRHVRVSVNPGVDPRGSGGVSVPGRGHPAFSHVHGDLMRLSVPGCYVGNLLLADLINIQ